MELGRNHKIIFTVAAIGVLMLFTQIGTGTLLGMVFALALIILGLVSYSRPTSVLGMMIASGSAAASLPQQSMTVFADLLNLAIGFFAPIYVLVWIALSAEDETRPVIIRRRPAIWTSVYAVACLLSVGVAALALGIVAPRVSVGMSTLMEIAIVLLVGTIGITVLTVRNPVTAGIAEAEREVGPE